MKQQDYILNDKNKTHILEAHNFIKKLDTKPISQETSLLKDKTERLDGVEIHNYDAILPLTAYEHMKTTGEEPRFTEESAEITKAMPHIRNIESALAKLPPYNGMVEVKADIPKAIIPMLKVGAIFRDSGFLQSSAINYFKDGHYRFIIKSKNGKMISDYTHHPERKEVLFSPATQFRILEINEDDNSSPIIIMEEISSPKTYI